MSLQNSKVEILESLRGFAALSVCLFHFVCTVTGFIKNELILDIFWQGQYGVQLFFVISGFVIPWSMYQARYTIRDFFTFFLKRLARLEPPYLFSLVLVLLLLFVREHFFGKANDHIEISGKQVFLHLGYLIPFFEGYKWLNTVYWTLAIEFQYYIFIALLFIPLVKGGLFVRLFFYCMVIAFSFIGGTGFLPHWLPVFLLGIILFLYKSFLIQKSEYFSISALLLSFCFYKYPFMSVVYVLIPVIGVLQFENLKLIGLHFAGKFSYSIYLIHPIIGTTFINVFSHHVTHPVGKLFLILSGLMITLVGAWLNYLFLEKPSKQLSARIVYKNKPAR